MDSLPDVIDAAILVDAEGKAGASRSVRFGRGIQAGQFEPGQTLVVEGVMRVRIVPARIIGFERFEAVFEVEVRDARPAR